MNKLLKTCLIAIISFNANIAFAQYYTLSGIITDSISKETLIGANVYINSLSTGCVTNFYGFYSIKLPKGKHIVRYSYVGYKVKTLHVDLQHDIRIDNDLQQQGELEQINVTAQRKNLGMAQMSTINISLDQTHKSPTIMGEADVFKLMQLSPGVEAGTEGSSGLFVRGGDNGQNLILIDGIPVYNVSHLMGYISVFNPEAIRKTDLLKGGIPARYGGRASSVVDVRMKEGNMNKLKGTVNISTLMAGGLIEGPISKNTGFMLAGRRTILDPIYSSFNNAQNSYDMMYSCWDINAKINHKVNSKNRLYASFFSGFDHARNKGNGQHYTSTSARMLPNGDFITDSIVTDIKNYEKHKWGNILGALRWNYIAGNKLFANTSITYSNFYNRHIDATERKEYNLSNSQELNKNSAFKSTSDIEDISVLVDFDWYTLPSHAIKFGGQGIYHQFRPIASFDSVGFNESLKGSKVKPAKEGAFYIEDNVKWGLFEFNFGTRLSVFNINNNTYTYLEPRLSFAFNAFEKINIKTSYMHASQFVHLVSPSSVGFSTDYWVPVSANLPPEQTNQFAIGAAFIGNNVYSFELECYYKEMQNVIEFRDNKIFTMEDNNWENFMLSGNGWAYGTEALLKKNSGKLTGWISYTWSRSWRKFTQLNMGKKYPFKYDRPHNLTIVAMYMPNNKIDYGINWMLASGYNFSFNKEKISKYETYYGKNNMRYPMYHRLDFGINLHKQKKFGKRTWRFGAYNAYNQMNASYYRIETPSGTESILDENGNWIQVTPDPKITKVTLFPIIPYVSYRYAFGEN